jgi:tetratricopeptide (TPR) repeat protein
VQVQGPDFIGGTTNAPASTVTADAKARDRLREAVARLDEAESRGRPADLIDALLPVARCYLSMGTYGAAEEVLRQALRAARRCGSIQLLVGVLTELAQATSLHARDLKDHDPSGARICRDRARDGAFEASTLIHRQAQSAWAAPALLAVSEVLSLCGDDDDAAAMRLRAAGWQAAR